MNVTRLSNGPIITPRSDASIGNNIQGPSLIRVPDWVTNPLGRYYLYFADHKGEYIRLAYADSLSGPWRIHIPGSLHLRDSLFPTQAPQPPAGAGIVAQEIAFDSGASLGGQRSHSAHVEASTTHIASPDVHVDHDQRQIVMYFHGLEDYGKQVTRLATSSDGLAFSAQAQVLGRTYFRVFKHHAYSYAMAMPGQIYRSANGRSDFESGPLLFNQHMRHSALFVEGEVLHVFWTQVGEVPERILYSTVDLSLDWMNWCASEGIEVMRPEFDWEGADAPLEPSIRSTAYGHVNQLRDPAVYREDGLLYLLYAVAGESGIAIARVDGLLA